jgi:prefoldin subunit 5
MPQQEVEALKEQAGWLKDQLDAINKRIAEIEAK